jgi:hypothetical protein
MLKKLRADFDEKTITSKEFEQRLRLQFQKLHPIPSWAQISEDTSSSNSILQNARALVANSNTVLDTTKIKVTRVKDANCEEYSQVL